MRRAPIPPIPAALAAVLAAASALPPPAVAAEARKAGSTQTMNGTASALEGDVLSLNGTRIRLSGIDAPDLGQTCNIGGGREYDCGEVARRTLAAILDGRQIECILSGPAASDGMRSGSCRSEGKSIAGAMVVRGWAFAAIKLSHEFVALQATAQSRKAGMWAGRVDAPWVWRSLKLQKDQ
ncbi:thermonuclease family protein [Arenibaculum pallidiluteum]|uniref:thermonuclease family protein n=1 Tax=Arenibaculum pallidiluteum TaxID=2812559 RepID=UPI001A957AF4|nr:thermonuclease family protein [Arenibaculum pallidiluteum]